MPDTASPLYWKRKLAAYLHDPPEKPYDFGPRHIERAGIHALSFGVDELWKRMGSNSDWTSAAADRFVFPSGQAIGKNLGEDLRPCFIHPLSGKENQPALPTDALKFPGQAEAEEWLGDIRPDWKSEDPHTLFLRAWRHWSGYAAQHPKGREKGAGLLPYLPADTRIADGSIWHHCAIVSALESTRSSDEPGAPLKPAFLLFQIGPVQDFIAQARSTRDLWSGSYLLSWLTMHAIKAVADHCGPDAILFPSLKGQPLYDFLEQQRLGLEQDFAKAARQEDVLVPGIPNRFLAVVPQDFDAEAIVAAAFKTEWHTIAATCRAWLEKEGIGFDAHHDQLWENQIASHWQLTWQLWPWQSADAALTAFQQIPLGRENAIHLAKAVAEAIPDAHKDSRCYRDGKLDPGWAWSAHYQLCQHALDARRSLRDFHGLPTDFTRKPGHRDALSGREEAVLQAEAMEEAVKKSTALKHLFRHIEPLGAANLIKRVWHKAYLARLQEVEGKKHLPNLTRARESFDSVPSVAAGAFASRLYQRAEKEGPLREKWLAFLTAASDARDDFPETIANFQDSSEPIWISRTDNSVFVSDLWSKELTRTKVASSTE
ncbi:MAG: type III-B CRISPR-associated protein Cas10/Cmr2, partial [Prosthecobacter sp.]|nr:type III-B CRISPR-associated protein Cas10/Cmr2 [Prosthecobacter sp.]